MASTLSSVSPETIKEQFSLIDADESGLIDRDELRIVLCTLGVDVGDNHMESMFRAMDCNKDGVVSFNEFVDFVFSTGDQSFFSTSDLDMLRSTSKETAAIPRASQNAEVASLQKVNEEQEQVIHELRVKLQRSQTDLEAARAAVQEARDERDVETDDPAELKKQIAELKTQLHEKTYAMQRLEKQQEKTAESYLTFAQSLVDTSATDRLSTYCDLKSAEMLGKGAYGFVMTCPDKERKRQVVVKLQGPRWVSVAAQEWAHGSECKHENIVDYMQVLMHHDSTYELERKIAAAFEDGTFTGKRPKFLPGRYICMIQEYMDRGTVQHLSDEGLINLEGLAAIVRQVTSALAYMHHCRRTHNDIKPENVLLRQASTGDHLIVKLADLGLGQHSVDRARDMDLTAYTFWCVGLKEKFEHMPEKSERQTAAARFAREALPKDDRPDLRLLLSKVVADLWSNTTAMFSVAGQEDLQGLQLYVRREKRAGIESNAKKAISAQARRLAALWAGVHAVSAINRLQHKDDADNG